MTIRWRRPNGTIPKPQTSRPPNTTAIEAMTSDRLMVNPMLAGPPV